MQYYKIIQDDTIIGVITSNDFIRYSDAINAFIGATPEEADLAEYKNKTYRARWMKPMNSNITILYTVVQIIEITQEEYNIIADAIRKDEIIVIEEDEEPTPYIVPVEEREDYTLDFIRESKLNEMSHACRTAIESGIDFQVHGTTKHFSLTTQDQLNLMSAQTMAQTQTLIPYHADGEETAFYTSEEINQLAEAVAAFKVRHTTYYNSLKTYINALDTIEEISAITYGVEIPDTYKSVVLKVLEL